MEHHEPTEETRQIVSRAAGLGLPIKQICALIGVSDPKVLDRYYKNDMIAGEAAVNIQVAKNLYDRTKKDTTASIWWTKSRMGWRETAPIEDEKSMKGLRVNVIPKATDDVPTKSD